MPHVVNPAVRIAAALADPLRYAVLDRLLAGPATVSELVALSGAAQSKLSNHLAVLRDARVVHATRAGRSMVYALADPAIATVLEALAAAAGDGRVRAQALPEIALARSCYDHVAGRLGVALFRALVARGALRDVAAAAHARKVRGGLGEVALGPRARRLRRPRDRPRRGRRGAASVRDGVQRLDRVAPATWAARSAPRSKNACCANAGS